MKFNYPAGATPLESEELADLIPIHLRTQEELNGWEERNILIAQEWAVRQKDIISITFVKTLHKQMFNLTWKWAGNFRHSEKNLGISWFLIPSKVKQLCDNINYQVIHQTYSLDEIAIRLHHLLVSIHPFPNGNGRHARLLANLLVTQHGGQAFSWGSGRDLSQPTPTRQQYIEALQSADHGNYSKLMIFARS